MESVEQIEKNIFDIQERNKKVELDKAWEVSLTRRFTIVVLTYVVAIIWLWYINENNISLKAMIPVLGYILSTFSIPQIKKIWIKKTKI